MKKALPTILVIAMMAFTASLATAQTFDYPVKGKQGFALTEKTRDGLHISYNLGQMTLSQLSYRGEEMSEISLSAITLPNNAGCPNLPVESRLLAIPQGATATLNVVHVETEILKNVNIAPALRIQSENEEPDMNYVKDMSVYGKNALYPAEPFELGSSYIRGIDAVVVSISPFQYNPVTKELVVYTNIELSVTFEGGNGHFGDDRLRSPYWDPILATELMNYDQLPVIDYEARMQQWLRDGADGAEYLIITPNNDAWAPYANQLKDYRTRQGIITEVYRLDEMPANSTDQLKSWFHNAYNTWEIAPVAVCLLGDHGTNMGQYIPAETVSHPYNGSCITDNRYADAVGNDNLPDMVFSRLIAQNANELPVFVGKQIEYEYGNPNTDPDFYTRPITALGWQTERWFQICSEVFGGYMRNHGYDPNRINCIYQGQPGNVWSSNQNTSMVVNYFGPNGVGYIPQTPSELGGWTGGTPEQVVQAVNEGAFWLQHRDHGLETGWGEPAVRNTHVYQMNNVGKMPFVMSINCLTGKFNYNSECFCEAWMRRTYNGENAGAVGVLCPTEVSYSFVNDTYVWGVYDLFDGDFMPDYGPYAANTGNWMPAFGNVAGKYFLAQSSWPSNPSEKDITYTMFTAHCDAFLRVYTQVPQEMEVAHPEVVLAGLGEVNITAPEGCMISMVKENVDGSWEILAVTEATGDPQNITFEPQVPPTEINLVITGQNYLRYEAVMSVIPADGPYIVLDSKTIHDDNGDGQIDYGESISLDVTLKNVGSEPIGDFEAVFETTSEYINIVNGTAQFSSINPNETQALTDAFSFTVADNVPDNTSNLFTITVTNGDDTYVSNLALKAFAPLFKLGNISITEINGNGNGRLDPGETAQLNFPIENKGHSKTTLVTAEMQILSPYLTITESTVFVDPIEAGASAIATFDIAVDENTPMGYVCPLVLNVVAGNYNASESYSAKVGLIIEDFESGEFGEGWSNDATHPWRIVTDHPYEGLYCAKSGSIGDNTSSTLTLQHEAGSNDTISFYYKVSSESGYDKLYFYIDNNEQGSWSGNVAWTKASYPVSEGIHNYKWTYGKDYSQSSGSDCAWIDYISLPAPRVMAGTAGNDVTICEDDEAQIVGYAIHYDNLLWTTSGDGTFDDATIVTPIYTPGAQDIANGSATLTININGGGETITDEMTVFITEKAVLEPALGGIHYCATQEPQTVAVHVVSGDYTSFVWTTLGSGEFADPYEMTTTYTPSAEDIAAGSVTLLPTVYSEGCGPVSDEYYIEWSPMPQINLASNAIELCEGENAIMSFSLEGFVPSNNFNEPDFTLVMDGIEYELTEDATTLDLGISAVGTTVHNINAIYSCACQTIFEDGELTFTVNVNAAPTLNVSDVPTSICEGETVNVEFNFTGMAPYTVEAIGMDSFTAESDSYTLTLTPAATVNATLTKVTDANGCETALEQAINVMVNPVAAQPEISGDNEVDVRLTPTSTYTIANDVIVGFSIEPEDAGTMLPANDGKSVVVTWSDTYKGEATLTATPTAECNNGPSSFTITVKNSTGISEFGVKASLYPNPTNGNITIEAEAMQRLTVVNELGQVVYDAEVNSDTETLNMSQFGTGIFIIRIHTENGVGTKRVTVIR